MANKELKAVAKQKKATQRKRQQRWTKFKNLLWIVIPCLIVIGIIGAIYYGEVSNKIDHSAGLTNDGKIEGVNVQDYIKLADYSGLKAKKSELVNDTLIDEKIQETLNENKVINAKSTAEIKDGDKVSINYKGTLDGEAFEGGSADNYDLEIGSGTFVGNFEEQLIGHKAGETFKIEVKFPDNYKNNPDLAGKDTVFEVTINGIYEAPELTDEYVAANFSDHATTVEEYRKYVGDTLYEDNLMKYAEDYMTDNSTFADLPKNYVKKLRHLYDLSVKKEYEYYDTYYYQYTGTHMWKDMYDYTGMTKEEYNKSAQTATDDTTKFYIMAQAIFEKEGLSITEADVEELILSSGYTKSTIETAYKDYGKGYWYQNTLAEKAIRNLMEKVEVTD